MTATDGFPIPIHPELAAAVAGWASIETLRPVHAAMAGHDDPRTFLDACAEAVVARRLLGNGAALRVEVPTPDGRAADFEATVGAHPVYFHVKRLDTAQPNQHTITISSRLRALERIERPYIVRIRWVDGTNDARLQRLVEAASEFILRARVGDELTVSDDDGTEIGGVLIVAPWDGTHVSLTIGLPTGFVDSTRRVRKLLRRAQKQFMPRAVNVIVLATSRPADRPDVESALFGEYVERWDAYPPRGRRVAHGRAADGFWHGTSNAQSHAAAWFVLDPMAPEPQIELWFREDTELTAAERARIERLLVAPASRR